MTELAKNVIRHSVVILDGKSYMIETKFNSRGKILLIDKDQKGKEIDANTILTVQRYPAQLAQEFLNSDAARK